MRSDIGPARMIGAIAGVLLTLAAYLVLLQALGNATDALAITEAIPLVWVIAIGISRRRVDRVAVAAVVVFAVALAVTAVTGGGSLPLKLKRAVFPGAVGLACLISLAIRRPLLTIALQRLSQARAGRPGAAPSPLTSPAALPATGLTAIIGVAMVGDASAQVALALTVSTSAFVGLARVASYATIGAGLAACTLYLRWWHTRREQRDAQPDSA